eukprot:8670209-Pyramimonas_sp.AAC.1
MKRGGVTTGPNPHPLSPLAAGKRSPLLGTVGQWWENWDSGGDGGGNDSDVGTVGQWCGQWDGTGDCGGRDSGEGTAGQWWGQWDSGGDGG